MTNQETIAATVFDLHRKRESGSNQITVRSCKFDGSLHRSWPAEIVRQTDDLIVLDGVFVFDVEHEWLGRIPSGTRTREYFWNERWYSLFQFFGPAGDILIQYVNINLPPALDGGELTFIDLDIDLLVKLDGTYSILDEDEFLTNAELFQYPAEIRNGVRDTVADLVSQIKSGQFPGAELPNDLKVR